MQQAARPVVFVVFWDPTTFGSVIGRIANFPPGIQLLNVVRSEKALKTYRAVVEDGGVVVEV